MKLLPFQKKIAVLIAFSISNSDNIFGPKNLSANIPQRMKMETNFMKLNRKTEIVPLFSRSSDKVLKQRLWSG